MRISVLIPCHNEEKSIQKCVESCLQQTRKFDEVIVINDGSTDLSKGILAEFGDQIQVVNLKRATGNKSYAQQRGLHIVTGDVFVATDGDGMLDRHFAEEVEKTMADPKIMAVGGYVKSLPINWLTACRAYEYFIGHNFHKLAQHYLNFMFVIPGAAGAFRTRAFRSFIQFDHDTITEDLDFTYKLNKMSAGIAYNRKCIVYTQDPTTLSQYVNQMRRWYGGGFQNLRKHLEIILEPAKALELSLIYLEGLTFSISIFLLPLINLHFSAYLFGFWVIVNILYGIWAAIIDKRLSHALVPLIYHLIIFINAYIFIEQFIKEIVLRRKNLIWFQPARVQL